MKKAYIIHSPKFYGHYAVLIVESGEIIDCANYKTAKLILNQIEQGDNDAKES